MPNAQKNMTVCATAAINIQLHIAGLEQESIVDGPGLRMTVFTQGCPHHCRGCHNPETHSTDGGYYISITKLINMYRQNPLLDGMTFSGGEPFMQALPLAFLAKCVHALGGNIITYTGFYLDELLQRPMADNQAVCDLIKESDWLIDGPYIQHLRSLDLPFRGSSNQRILKNAASRAS